MTPHRPDPSRAMLARVLDALNDHDSIGLSEIDDFRDVPALLGKIREAVGARAPEEVQREHADNLVAQQFSFERDMAEAVARVRREAIEECIRLGFTQNMPREKLGVLAAQPADTTCWLIERGPNEGQVPHLWYTGRPRQDGKPYGGVWSESAHDAQRFTSKRKAQECGEMQVGKWFAVTRHSFFTQPADKEQRPGSSEKSASRPDAPAREAARAVVGEEEVAGSDPAPGSSHDQPETAQGNAGPAVQFSPDATRGERVSADSPSPVALPAREAAWDGTLDGAVERCREVGAENERLRAKLRSWGYAEDADTQLRHAKLEIERLRAELAEWNDPDSPRRQALQEQIIFDLGEGSRSEIDMRESQLAVAEAANAMLHAELARLRPAAEAMEKLEAWLREDPDWRYVGNAYSDKQGCVFELRDGRGAGRSLRGSHGTMAAAILSALAQAQEADRG